MREQREQSADFEGIFAEIREAIYGENEEREFSRRWMKVRWEVGAGAGAGAISETACVPVVG